MSIDSKRHIIENINARSKTCTKSRIPGAGGISIRTGKEGS